MLPLLFSINTSYRGGISFALKIYSLISHAGRLVTLTPLCYSNNYKTHPCNTNRALFLHLLSLESSRSHTFIFAKLAVARKQKKNAGNGSVGLGNMQAQFSCSTGNDRNFQMTFRARNIQGCLLIRKPK